MIETLIYGYLAGWLLASVALAFAVRKINDRIEPQLHPVPLLLLAGLAWPILVLGVVEFASVAATSAVVSHDDHALPVKV